MSKLIFMRHAMPAFHSTDAHTWHLADEGRAACAPMAHKLAPYNLTHIITSDEPKAIETGQLVADVLQVPCTTAPDLHEQLRHTSPWFDNEADRTAAILKLFTHPDELVYGEETGNAAYARFAAAVDAVLAQYPADATLGIVTHGTVLALWLGHHADVDPITFWRNMGIPLYVVLNSVGNGHYTVETIVNDVLA